MSTQRPYAPPDDPDEVSIEDVMDDVPEGELDFNDNFGRGPRDLFDERDDDFEEEDFDEDMDDGDLTLEEALEY